MKKSQELIIEIKKGIIYGGGLPHDSYVETVINGEVFDTTAPKNPPEWNKVVTKPLPEILDGSMIILFAVYKKRWTAPGFKLVGTVEFSLDDLINDIRKFSKSNDESPCGSINKEVIIKANKKNLTLSGSLYLRLELKEQLFITEKKVHLSPNNRLAKLEENVSITNTNKNSFNGRRKMADLFSSSKILDLKGHKRTKSQPLRRIGSNDVLDSLFDSDGDKDRSDYGDKDSFRNSESISRLRSSSYHEVSSKRAIIVTFLHLNICYRASTLIPVSL